MASVAAWQNTSVDTQIPARYRSNAQSPRPSAGSGKRFFPNQPPTPDQPADRKTRRNWEDLGTTGRTTSILGEGQESVGLFGERTSRRASFLSYLQNHPEVAVKRNRRLADGTNQTTVHKNATTSTATTATITAMTTRTTTNTSTYQESHDAARSRMTTNRSPFATPTEYEMETTTRLFEQMDANHDGRVSWDEFLQWWSRESEVAGAGGEVDGLLAKNAFEQLDLDGNGHLSKEELQKLLELLQKDQVHEHLVVLAEKLQQEGSPRGFQAEEHADDAEITYQMEGDGETGTTTVSQVAALLASGDIDDSTEVWSDGMDEWEAWGVAKARFGM